jgi:hypothetical protein
MTKKVLNKGYDIVVQQSFLKFQINRDLCNEKWIQICIVYKKEAVLRLYSIADSQDRQNKQK